MYTVYVEYIYKGSLKKTEKSFSSIGENNINRSDNIILSYGRRKIEVGLVMRLKHITFSFGYFTTEKALYIREGTIIFRKHIRF